MISSAERVRGNNGMLLAVRSAGLQAATTGTVPASSVHVPKGLAAAMDDVTAFDTPPVLTLAAD
jgi:hypothetical protein